MITEFIYHIYKRGLIDSNYRLQVYCWVDLYSEDVVFPIYHYDKLIGYQQYNWNETKKRSNYGKYYTYVSDNYKSYSFWGMEYLFGDGPLIVTEGIFDAIRAINCGYRAVALLTATPNERLIYWFNLVTSGQYKVCIKDKKGDQNFLHRISTKVVDSVDYDDLNDYPQEEAKEFLKQVV